ncbi:MAG TPA: hypothetical protein ENF23_02845 [Methanosarcinales archaeon]|nr:hypothetical protein [Methanosarcinales archaeon]
MHRQIMILIVLICFLAAPALAAQMSVEPAYQEVFQGDNITVNITVTTEGDENVYAASYTLYFNNTLLNATSLAKGPFLSHDGNPSYLQRPPTEIDNAAGEIKYAEYKIGTVPGVTGYGVLSTITFQVIGEEGTSQLNLSDLDFALLYSAPPDYGPVPTTLNNGGVEIRKGICGDVNDDGVINMADVMTLWYDYANYPTPGVYEVSNAWAADVNCDGNLNMADVMTLWYDYANYPTPGAHVVNCCGG